MYFNYYQIVQQLSLQVVEEHNKVVNFRAKLIQSEKESQNQEPTTEAQDSTNIDINEKLVKVGKDSSTSKLSAKGESPLDSWEGHKEKARQILNKTL